MQIKGPLMPIQALHRPTKALSGKHEAFPDLQNDLLGPLSNSLLKPNRAPKACTWPSQTNARPHRPSKALPRITLVPLRPTVCLRLGRKGDFIDRQRTIVGRQSVPLEQKKVL